LILSINDRKLIRILLSKSNHRNSLQKLFNHVNNFATLPAIDDFNLVSESQLDFLLKKLDQESAEVLTILSNKYPVLLKQIFDPPGMLFCKGNLKLLGKAKISIIGGRNSSYSDLNFIKEVAMFLANNNLIIVSGLANGVDTSAHFGAGADNTIAVIASGLDICYPKQNYRLFEEIKAKGLVISENDFGCPPLAKLFPRRNRIIVGLSNVIIASNVKMKSGSMITCRLVVENNRDLIVVPGSPFDMRHVGSNKLIADGANIFTNFDDLGEFLNNIYNTEFNGEIKTEEEKHVNKNLERKNKTLLNLIPANGINMEDLMINLKVSQAEFLEVISELEMLGYIVIDHCQKVFLTS